jgi:N-methylhydantoinase A
VTDANLFLGRLDPGYFLGGKMRLDTGAAARALDSVAAQIGLEDQVFAEGMLSIVNANMADAMRTITVKQGIDPREYSLVAFGGAGPMHAAWLAEELDIGEVIVPWSPGTFSAWGMLQTDMRHDLTRTYYRPLAEVDPADVLTAFRELEREGAQLLREQDVTDADVYFARSADMRYVGQEYSVTVPIAVEIDPGVIDASFHDAHRIRYGHSTPGAPVELVNLRVAAMGRIAAGAVPFRPPGTGEDPLLGWRPVTFGGEAHDTAAVLRPRLVPGASFAGPLVVEDETATTVIPPGYRMTVDDFGNLLVTRLT